MRLLALQLFILYLTATEETIAARLSPLGLASGLIKDDQISASSFLSPFLLPSAGRLHNTMSSTSLGAWCSDEDDTNQWFEIDLLTTTNVSAVASQGVEIKGDGGHWVTQYSLNYSCDGVRWFSHNFQGTQIVFNGNNDSDSVVINPLPVPILARFLRVRPAAWNLLGKICLRLELYGYQTSQVCPHPTQDPKLVVTTKATTTFSTITRIRGKSQLLTLSPGPTDGAQFTDRTVGNNTNATPVACSNPLGMQSGAINDSQIQASSIKTMWTRPSEGRLHNQWSVHKISFGGWCADDSDNNPYLQVDMVNTTIVTAVAAQGLPGDEDMLLRYKLNFSCDGKTWFEYQQGKILDSYRNNRRVKQNTLTAPVIARLVRVRPLVFNQDEKACVRLELYGCKRDNKVCGNKSSSNPSANPDQYSSLASSTTQATLTDDSKRPTKQKDMLVIVRAQDQRPHENNAAGFNAARKNFIFLAFIILLLNCF